MKKPPPITVTAQIIAQPAKRIDAKPIVGDPVKTTPNVKNLVQNVDGANVSNQDVIPIVTIIPIVKRMPVHYV